MWTKPWTFKEGFTIGGGLLTVGFMLDYCVGAISWEAFAFPINIIILIVYLMFMMAIYALQHKIYAFRFIGSYISAISALAYAALLTIIMGLTRQGIGEQSDDNVFGFQRMLSFWPFVMIYIWMSVVVAQVTIKRIVHLRWKEIPFLLNHAGLLIVLLCATLGYADMQRYKMTTQLSFPEWRAFDEKSNMHELPIAIQLKDFTINEYPPKLILVDAKTGTPIPSKEVEPLLLDSTFKSGKLQDWSITINKLLDEAAPMMTKDTTNYLSWHSSGAVTAANITAQSKDGKQKKTGWITCGSYQFPYQILALDDKVSIAMPEREPQRYISKVEIMTEKGKHETAIIEVNKPYIIEGWKIYQVSYNEKMGKWSNTSVLELVKDPWLPAVYSGIFMMLLGAVCMFITPKRKKENQP